MLTTFCSPAILAGDLTLDCESCRFEKYQEVKVQEVPEEVPEGCTPRTLLIKVKGDLCRSVKQGDLVRVHGVYLPIRQTGMRALRAGLKT